MLVYAKRSLTGTAKQVIHVNPPKSWQSFKKLLTDEFSIKKSSAEIHKLLSTSTKKYNESYLSYVIRMQQIATAGNIETESLIFYLIQGINDKPENKVLLYGAKSLKEFKEKLEIYETFKCASQKCKAFGFVEQKSKESTIGARSIQCNYCKSMGHDENVCRQKRLKCYKCKQYGHKSQICPNSTVTSNQIQQASTSSATQFPTKSPNNQFPTTSSSLPQSTAI